MGAEFLAASYRHFVAIFQATESYEDGSIFYHTHLNLLITG